MQIAKHWTISVGTLDWGLSQDLTTETYMAVIKKSTSEIITPIKVAMDGMIFREALLLHILKWVGGHLGHVCMWSVSVLVEVKSALVGWDGVVRMVVILLLTSRPISCPSCKSHTVYRTNNFSTSIPLPLCFSSIKKNLMYSHTSSFKHGCCRSSRIVFLHSCVHMSGLHLVWICQQKELQLNTPEKRRLDNVTKTTIYSLL